MIISRAPLRVSFFGGGTDFPEYFRVHGGAVLATAIDKYSFVTASPFRSILFDYAIRISYRNNEAVTSLDKMEHPVFRECLRLLKLEKDIEVHTVADLPAFTGLGSSSTFTVSLLHALHSYKGDRVAPLDLAYEAIHVEREVLGECVGCQDQTTAAVGGFNVLEFRSETDIRVHPLGLPTVRLEELQAHLIVAFTGVKRRAANIETRKLRGFQHNEATLRRMRAMVDAGRNILCGPASLEEFGRLLHESWLAKRSLEATVSNTEIDDLYREGLAAGAWGGKLLGAGGGGFVVFVAPPEAHNNIRSKLASKYILDIKLNAPGSEIIFGNKA